MNHSGEARRSRILLLWLSMLGLAFALSACGNSGNEDPLPPGQPPQVINLPPTANAGIDQVALTGASVSLTGTGTDSDGSIATYAWTQTAGTNVTLTGANNANASFTAPAAAGDLTFQLSVTDNAGAARTDTITINVNASPMASAGTDQSVSAGANVTLSGAGTDANGSIATYAWTQLSGSAVTLSSASVAAPTFTAPNSATTLEFRLTVTDNQGATHFDNVTINVTAITGPVIVRQPGNTIAYEHGAALMFVVARGENLNYEWRHNSVVVQSGPEPILMRGTISGLGMSNDGDCYTVVVSNAAGSATSAESCLTIIETVGDLDPYDDQTGDDYDWAWGYAGALMGIAQSAAGRLTGAVGANSSAVPRTVEPPHSCLMGGQFIGATLDGHPVTAGAFLPLGQHTVSMHWNECANSEDVIEGLNGGMLITYNFPNVFGVGTYTMHFSGLGYGGGYNGSLDVTTTRTSGALGNVDETLVTLRDDFCSGAFRLSTGVLRSLDVERRFNIAGDYIDDAYVDFDISMSAYDEEGYAGRMYQNTGSSVLHLHQQPGTGDNNDPTHTASGLYVVGFAAGYPATEYFTLATFEPVGGFSGWGFEPVMPDEEE